MSSDSRSKSVMPHFNLLTHGSSELLRQPNFQPPLVNFTIHTWTTLKHFHLRPFHTRELMQDNVPEHFGHGPHV